MTKASLELRLLRQDLAAEAAQPPQGGGGEAPRSSTLKLVEFAQKDGDAVAINPNHVAAVEQRGVTTTSIQMQDGTSHTVEVAFTDVVSALQE